MNARNGREGVPCEPYQMYAFIADLELEVDRLRKQSGFIRQEVRDGLKRIERLTEGPADGAALSGAIRELATLVHDLHDPPGYHPAYDQVVAIAIRPLAEQVFRAQRRLTGNKASELRLVLQIDHVEWFPARLRHILDNLFSNALRYRDPSKSESWVHLGLRETEAAYEFRVFDNGLGFPTQDGGPAVELLSRADFVRNNAPAVGLSVVRILVQQSGGSLSFRSDEGSGTEFLVTLPRYDLSDYLT